MKLARTALALSSVAALLVGTAPLQASADPTNLGLNRPVTASGTEASFSAERAFDGEVGPADPTPPTVHNDPAASRWSANSIDTPWIAVDLGAPADVTSVRVRWGNQFGTNYSLLGSKDGSTWTELKTGLVGAKATWVDTPVAGDDIRHVKLQVHSRNSTWPVSIWEIEVLGTMENPPVEQAPLGVVPLPVSAVTTEGAEFRLDEQTSISADDSPAAARLAETLRASTGLPLPEDGSGDAPIEFVLDEDVEVPGVEREGYLLESGADGVTITAQTEAGLANGAETLIQLLGSWARSEEPVIQDWSIPALNIEDGPRYEWRGFMLDSSRSFVPVDEVYEIIDQLAAYKLNVLHMHMTDDQGWRIAITNEGRVPGDTIDYSLLTSVSGGTAVATTQWTNLPGRTGFYSAQDFADIVAYAAERNVAIVPEVDGPAHAQSILHAIPEANTSRSVPQPLAGQSTAPNNPTTSVGESTLDTRAEATYTILNQVFTQLLDATPSELNGTRYLHIGGDESFSTSNEDYRYFIDRVSENVNDLDATVMAWNEGAAHAADELPDGSVIHYWTGGTNATRDWVNANNGRALMSPAGNAYLPQIPGAGIAGPSWACGTACNIERFYNWNPTAMLGAAEDKVLGVEAPLWSEHIRSLSSAEFLMYPRLMATAEVGWTPQERRNLADFRERVKSVATDLTVTGRNFFPGDGAWRTDLVTLQTPTSAPDAVGEIAHMAAPTANLAEVRAKLTIDGTDHDVDVAVDRAYASGVGTGSFDNRQASGLFRFEPSGALPDGEHLATLTVTVAGATSQVEVPLSIDGAAPVIAPVADVTAQVGDTVSVQVQATDASELITFSAAGLPAGLTIDAATGTISGTVTAEGTSPVTLTATDSFGNSSSVEFTVKVAAKPSPSPTPEPTPTKSPTAKPTPTKSPTAKPTPSKQPTPSPTGKPGFTPSAPYTLPGVHQVNGRTWNTTCESYSQTTRCRTDIWASVVIKQGDDYVVKQGWAFNNLTYLPYMSREQWKSNPLGYTNRWTAQDGRQWMTECDTAATGRGACRSYTWTSVVSAKADGKGGHTFTESKRWVFNNLVLFK